MPRTASHVLGAGGSRQGERRGMLARVALLGEVDARTFAVLDDRYGVVRMRSGAVANKRALAACEVLVTNGLQGVTADELDRFPALKLVASLGSGVDTDALGECRARGLQVTNTPGVLAEDVADLALGLLIAAVRRICVGHDFVRNGRWPAGRMPLTGSLRGARVGMIGLGKTGRALARRLVACGVEMSYHCYRTKSDIDYRFWPDLIEMAKYSTILVACCPGGDATRGIVSREVLSAIGPRGTFVNVGHGSVVDEPAMIELLETGRLGAAALDVFADEPNVPEALMALDNVVLQPHQGSATADARHAMSNQLIDNIEALFAGRALLSPVDDDGAGDY
ncbi:2-hydroxyacid dehydrogenase [Rhizorhabdus dicambivorans]|nr:2-hydroxyacid dehydrogenase [Rhizorhabdus dicambivorans]